MKLVSFVRTLRRTDPGCATAEPPGGFQLVELAVCPERFSGDLLARAAGSVDAACLDPGTVRANPQFIGRVGQTMLAYRLSSLAKAAAFAATTAPRQLSWQGRLASTIAQSPSTLQVLAFRTTSSEMAVSASTLACTQASAAGAPVWPGEPLGAAGASVDAMVRAARQQTTHGAERSDDTERRHRSPSGSFARWFRRRQGPHCGRGDREPPSLRLGPASLTALRARPGRDAARQSSEFRSSVGGLISSRRPVPLHGRSARPSGRPRPAAFLASWAKGSTACAAPWPPAPAGCRRRSARPPDRRR